MRALAGALVAVTLAAAACGDDGPGTQPAPAPATARATTTTEPKPPIPPGKLVAVPVQHRQDPPAGRFQLQFMNDTDARYEIGAVRLVWDGMTTELAQRNPPSVLVAGQTVDYPVALAPANCAGDGTRATMPSLAGARAELHLTDGTVQPVAIVDHWHVARKLYEQDCARQLIEAAVAIEWTDLREEHFEDRPITVAELRLTRGTATGAVIVHDIGHTVPFQVDPVLTAPGEPVVVLESGAETVSVPVRFLESRCDPHALAEIKQPVDFVVQVDLGDGEIRAYIARPDRDRWDDMRLTADRACVALGEVEFLGEG